MEFIWMAQGHNVLSPLLFMIFLLYSNKMLWTTLKLGSPWLVGSWVLTSLGNSHVTWHITSISNRKFGITRVTRMVLLTFIKNLLLIGFYWTQILVSVKFILPLKTKPWAILWIFCYTLPQNDENRPINVLVYGWWLNYLRKWYFL